jgi:citrate synthase
LHGGADEEVARVLASLQGESDVHTYIDETLAAGGRIPGFGHAVYRTGDPRAMILRGVSENLATFTKDQALYDLATLLADGVTARTGLLPNLDFYSAVVYAYLDIPSYLYAPLFAIGRLPGWLAHILEQYSDNRLIRPRAQYIGYPPRPYVPLAER